MRREAKIPSKDAIDLLIANGDSDDVVIGVSALNRFYDPFVIRFGVSADRDGDHFCWGYQHGDRM